MDLEMKTKSATGDTIINMNDGVQDETEKEQEVDLSSFTEQFGDSTTLHGAQYIIGSQKHILRRLFWLLIVICCLTWASMTITGMVIKYNKFESSTKVTKHYNESMIFPAVTFCNLNQWRRSGSIQLTIDMVAAIYGFNETLREQFDWDEYYRLTQLGGDWNLTASALNPVFGAASLEEMLLECYWDGGEECDASDFEKTLTDFGVCYTFNNPSKSTGAVRSISRPGTGSGLTLTLDIIHDEYIVGEFQGAGIKVALHTPGQQPIMKESGFMVSTGFETLVSVKETKNTALPEPFKSNCTEQSLKYSDLYTVPMCLYECQIDHVVKVCGCRDYRYPKESHKRLCLPDDMLLCSIPVEKNASSIKCSGCPIPCLYNVYKGSLSSSFWPSIPVQKNLIKAYPERYNSADALRNNLLRMTVFYDEISYVQVDEVESYSFASLEGDIGGTLGLLCGMSIITVFEFVDFFCVLFFQRIWKKEKTGEKQKLTS